MSYLDATASRIAASAARLEAEAALLRPTNKHAAMTMLKEAEKLRRQAKHLDVQFKRRQRVAAQRATLKPATPLLNTYQRAAVVEAQKWADFFETES